MDTNSYIAFLVLGAVLVAIDGQIIYRSGRKYLEHSQGDSGAGTSMARLVTVLFHLVVLGVMMLVSTVDVGDTPAEGVILRLGIVLLLLAAAHALTIAILARIKDRQIQEQLAEEMTHLPGTPQVPAQSQAPAQTPVQAPAQTPVQAVPHDRVPDPTIDTPTTPPRRTP